MLIIRPGTPLLALMFIVFFSCKKSSDPTPTTPTSSTLSISTIAPTSDTIGAKIVINGSNFDTNPANDIVKINGISAEVISATATQLTILIPAGATSGTISVTVNGRTVTSADTITLLGPAITSFSPAIIGIGYPLTITGSGFSADPGSNIVQINGTPATITSVSNTSITVAIPLNATTGKISVTTKGQMASSSGNLVVKKLTVTTLAGSLTGPSLFSDGTGSQATFFDAWNIIPDGQGNFYIADGGDWRIRKMTSGGTVTTFAGLNVQGNVDGAIANATFANPYGIAMDSHGNIFVSDLERNNIRKISTTGVVSTFAGDPNGNPGSADGSGIAARFNQPLGIVIDKSDNVYVADNSNYKVRKITPGGIVSTLAGNGTSNFADGIGTAAGFSTIVGICLDLNGNLLVCDNGVHRIRKITQTGVVSTFAGDGTSGAKDGPALSASFNFPVGIVADQSGNFYVTDQANATIRMISSDGNVYTLAGNGKLITTDGVGYSASFNYPSGITMGAANELEVIDLKSGDIRKIIIE